ncbi:SDR family NAD(P)-dependent oxidoreductase [Nocardia sp. CDC159]|uniref:SDR family NAD(P)-dependent oxidoreductase n=1 Tax=Nocardia pulmonis TaxID=2951408 RepID=A0A9X2E356_9NOCA|nr:MULTISPECIES: SDR family NAD(P)-dependent oxidoreductase [Nocardia]MCM6771990.1 SDR family NAD(P)-dependent oxidoreductase [Nocardia pulmonis]MCM6785352.1 SDR family NAD(P)-dependent oxidoreductase [Nocardia sp. CDC159]
MTESRQLALVTGASSGIGLEIARQFQSRGFDLVIAAEDAGIRAAAESLNDGTEVRAVQADLRTAAGVERLYATATEGGRQLDAAALNAGVGRGGTFLETDLSDEFDIIDLNVRSTVQLAKLVVRDMAARGTGKLLFTSSIAATMPGPRQAVYNASKSFVLSFAEALRDELRGNGITVTALLPGPTDTDFFRRAKMLGTRIGQGPKDDPADVARQGVAALFDGERRVVAASLAVKAAGLLNHLLPEPIKARMNRIMSMPTNRAG